MILAEIIILRLQRNENSHAINDMVTSVSAGMLSVLSKYDPHRFHFFNYCLLRKRLWIQEYRWKSSSNIAVEVNDCIQSATITSSSKTCHCSLAISKEFHSNRLVNALISRRGNAYHFEEIKDILRDNQWQWHSSFMFLLLICRKPFGWSCCVSWMFTYSYE